MQGPSHEELLCELLHRGPDVLVKGLSSFLLFLYVFRKAFGNTSPKLSDSVDVFCKPGVYFGSDTIKLFEVSVCFTDLISLVPLAVICFPDLEFSLPASLVKEVDVSVAEVSKDGLFAHVRVFINQGLLLCKLLQCRT